MSRTYVSNNAHELKKIFLQDLPLISNSAKAGLTNLTITGEVKEDLGIKNYTINNFSECLESIFIHVTCDFESASEFTEYIKSIVSISNGNLCEKDNIFRREKTASQIANIPIKYGVDYQIVEEHFLRFCSVLFTKISQKFISLDEAVKVAAWVHYQIEIAGYYFADGNSRIAYLIATFVVLKFMANVDSEICRKLFVRRHVNIKNYVEAQRQHNLIFQITTFTEWKMIIMLFRNKRKYMTNSVEDGLIREIWSAFYLEEIIGNFE